MTPERRAWIRSPRGQLSLLGWVFLGSILFSIGVALTRDAFWLTTVYEKYDEVPERLASLTPDQLVVLPPEDLRTLYGQRIDTGAGIDPTVLARRPADFHGWLRGTIVTGSPEQRLEATRLLPVVLGKGLDEEVRATATYAAERARRLGDSEWEALASTVLDGP